MWSAAAAAAVVALTAAPGSTPATPRPHAVTLLLAGDVMLGRGVAPVAAADPGGLFAGVRDVVGGADLALANLESPLTAAAHTSAGPHALEADPATAGLVAAAGFDVLSVANNHTGDAGPASVLDTVDAVRAAGMAPVGAGRDRDAAMRPVIVDVHGVRVGVLAFDATGAGLHAGAGPGAARWESDTARQAVTAAADRSDVVVVSLHGGVEHLPDADPRVLAMAEQLVAWGADVVWGHGPHVVQPVTVMAAPNGRVAVVASSVGNLLFDQRGPRTGRGAVLEVLVDRSGVIAHRTGATSHADLRVHFDGWSPPMGDAALVAGEWWELARDTPPTRSVDTTVEDFPWGTVVAAATGRVTSHHRMETIVSFRHRPGPHPVRDGLSGLPWTDRGGRSAHLGIYRAADLAPVWVAGMVPAPVAGLAACDGAVALAYSTLDDPAVIATSAAVWRPRGLDAAVRLEGGGRPMCADVDGDGTTDPIIIDRTSEQTGASR